MSSIIKNRYFMSPFLLLLPSVAFGADIKINTVCVQGTCPPPSGTSDALQFNQSIGLSNGSYGVTFGNGDQYSITWTYSASYGANGTAIFVNPVATYIGGGSSVGNDVIVFDMLQNYYDASQGTWDGVYSEYVPLQLSANAGAGSTVSAELFFDGQGLGLVGPFGPGSHYGQNSVNLTGLSNPQDPTGNTLLADYQFTYDFQAGTAPGASASSPSPVPEPAQTLPVGLALAGIACYCLLARRRSSYTK